MYIFTIDKESAFDAMMDSPTLFESAGAAANAARELQHSILADFNELVEYAVYHISFNQVL